MLHKDHGGPVGQQQLLQLHPGVDVHVVQRLVPDVKVSRLTEALGQEDLLFLSGAVRLQRLIKLAPGKAQLPQDGLEKGLLRPTLPDEVLQLPPEKGGVLGQHGHRWPHGGPPGLPAPRRR